MKVLIIDNYDSFTFNLYQYVGEILQEKMIDFSVLVSRNDTITYQKIREQHYDKIIISPGPGDPSNKAYFGVCADVLLHISKDIPTLGVCLGMQGMAYYFGGKIIKAEIPMHGKISTITHNGSGVFQDLPQEIDVMRYHSLIAERSSLPACLQITAVAKETGEIMGLRHREYPLEGVQFHPESFATDAGTTMLANFLYRGGKNG